MRRTAKNTDASLRSRSDVCRPPALDDETWAGVVADLKLSPQQARIMGLIAQGMSDKRMASELGIAYGTVRTYLDRLVVKLGAENRIALVVRVFEVAQRVRERRISLRPHGQHER